MSEQNKEIKTKIEDLSEGGLKDETLKEATGGMYTGGLGPGVIEGTTGTSRSSADGSESCGESASIDIDTAAVPTKVSPLGR
jgi:hypothetical protein